MAIDGDRRLFYTCYMTYILFLLLSLPKYAVNYAARALVREVYHYVRNDIRDMASRPITSRKVIDTNY